MRADHEEPLPDWEGFADAERRARGLLHRDRAGTLPALVALVLAAVAVLVLGPDVAGLG